MRNLLKRLMPMALIIAAILAFSGCFGTEEKECATHSFDEGVVTKKPHCGSEGEKTFTCSVCGKTKIESIPATGEHSFSEDGEVVKAATCNEKGVKRFACTVCGATKDEEIDTLEGHVYDEGVITKEPTCYEDGTRLLTCTLCGSTLEKTEEILPPAYTVTMEGFGEFLSPESGAYKLPDPEKIGFAFVKWVDGEGNDFPSEGVITSDITVVPVFELLETKTVEELEERAVGGAETILIVNDIVIDRTIYFTGKTQIISDKAIKLIREENFAGELFVVGEASDGSFDVLANGIAELTLGSEDGSSSITLDGNRADMKKAVVGSAIFVVNSSRVSMYDGVIISNHMKVGNERSLLWKEYIGESCTMGGSAIFIAHGQFDMYGGRIENNSVNTENINADDEDPNNEYVSSFGGAVYNVGTFNMYGGVIRNNSAVRGGAIFTRKQTNILAGVIEDNIAYNKGGAICASESPYAEVFLGSEDAEEGTVVFKNNVAISQGGVYLGYHYSPITVLGGVLFEDNRAERSVGGVIATAGPVTVRNSVFKGNYAFESGGAIYQYYIGEGFATHAVDLDGCLFEGNEAGRGGVMLISAVDGQKKASTVTVINCKFKDNRAVKRVIESVDAETGESLIKTSYGSGGVIYVTKKTSLTIKDSTFDGNSAQVNAGALYLTTDTVTSVKNSSFSGNKATVYGGVLYAAELKALNITSCEFESNGLVENGAYATERGGAIYTADSTVTTLDCRFVGNSASIGGAVYVAGKGTYVDKAKTSGETVLHSVFEGNRSGKGGAVCAYGAVELGGAELIENVADENGGAIYGGSNAVIVAEECSFDKNKVSIPKEAVDVKRFGGAVYVINASLTVKDSSFAENGFEIAEGATGIKTYGGALSASGTSTMTVMNASFEGNVSDYGGAIAAYSMTGNALNATGITFKGNHSTNCGGAAYINEAKATLTDIVAEGNRSRSGGVFYLSETDEVKVSGESIFKENTATLNGGAWFVGEEAKVSDESSVFESNTAVNGGAVYINSSKKTDEQSGEEIVNIGEASFVGSTFTGNKANLDENDSRGGAILVSGGKVSAENVTFGNNLATYYGGAITGNTDSTIDLKEISLINNSAGNNGGAIWAYFGSEIIVKGIDAKGNVSGGNGGVIYTRGDVKVLTGDGTENIFGGTAEGELNEALGGGVIFVLGPEGEGETSNIELSDTKFIGNAASENGGAVNLTRASVKMDNCEFESNGADKYGGALHLSACVAKIEGSIFKNNASLDNGGAMYVTQTPEGKAICTEKCSFESNASGKNGGAVYVTGTGAYVDGDSGSENSISTFKSNTALGGGAIYAYGSVELNYTYLEGNIAELGGAIGVNVTKLSENESTGEIVYSAGKITLLGSDFISNKAETEKEDTEANGGAIYVYAGASVSDNSSVYSGNGATKGGAIYVAKASGSAFGRLSLEGSGFDSNESLSHGGAVCVYNGADLDAKNCTFGNNKTTGVEANGGAMYIYAAAATLENNKFDSNSSAYRGGAIYATQTSEGSEIVTGGCEFTANNAAENGGAIYLTGTSIYRDGDADGESGSTFEGNSAANGGAIMTHGKLTLIGSSFNDNTATGGGAVYVGGGSFNDLGSSYGYNKAGLGGAIYAAATLDLAGASFDSNEAISGGAIFADSDLKITDGVFSNNVAYAEDPETEACGGAIYIVEGVTVEDVSSTYLCNSAEKGGAIYLEKKTAAEQGAAYLGIGAAFDDNTASSYGGAVCAYHFAELYLENAALYGNSAENNGGAVWAYTDSSVTFKGIEAKGNAAAGNGGVIYTRGDVYILSGEGVENIFGGNGESDENIAKNGGAIYLYGYTEDKPSVAEIAGAVLIGNKATENGGVIGTHFGKLTLTDVVFEGNEAGKHGGAIHSTLSELKADGCRFISNTANNNGGAIYVTQSTETLSTATVGGIFEENSAKANGGAIYVTGTGAYADGDATEDGGSKFNYNTASLGGAIAVYGSAELNGTVLTGNTAIQGGAIYVTVTEISAATDTEDAKYSLGRLTLDDAKLELNGATVKSEGSENNGGAIYANTAEIVVNNSSFTKNSASYRGGAIYLTKNSTEMITRSCTFTENTAVNNGGAIYLTGTSIYRDGDADGESGSTFEGNSAANGGGVMSYGNATFNGSKFTGNNAANGGAVMTNGDTVINGGGFTGNSAVSGGAVYVVGKTLKDNGSEYSQNCAENGGAIYVAAKAEVISSTFEGNSVSTETEDVFSCGGAIYLAQGATLMESSSKFADNTADWGGAVYIAGNADLASSAFTGNTAEQGGGLYVVGSVALKDLTFTSDTAKFGGAVYVVADASFADNGSEYKNNVAITNGGAIYTCAEITLENAEFVGNQASVQGGAIYLYHTAADVKGCLFNGNTATDNNEEQVNTNNQGGAIYIYYSAAEIDSCEFVSNSAAYRGGALYMTQTPADSEVVTRSCIFKNNSATNNNGGAIYLTGTSIYRDGDADGENGSTFEGNTAASGGAIMAYGKATLNGSRFTGNTASESGGAIYSAKALEVTDSTFENNVAVKSGGAIYAEGSLSVNGGEMSGNKVTGSTSDYIYMGGGIAVGASTVAEIKNVSFVSNVGGASGGAIAGYGASSTVAVVGCYFEGNSASNGGAIYAGGKSVFTVADITAKGNHAATYGAIIYVTSADTSLTLNSITFYNNNTAKNVSCGMAHLANASATLNVYLDGVVMLDSATEEKIEISNWEDLLLNPKNGTVNQLTASQEG